MASVSKTMLNKSPIGGKSRGNMRDKNAVALSNESANVDRLIPIDCTDHAPIKLNAARTIMAAVELKFLVVFEEAARSFS